MITYWYAGFDGHKHHGCINDRVLMESTQDELWEEVIEYVIEKCGGKATIKIAGTKEIITVNI